MIFIQVDEGAVFDMLSICSIKMEKQEDECSHVNAYNGLFNDIVAQIGHEKIWKIIQSEEYNRLTETNKKIFDFVDKSKKDEVKASEVDALNYNRYKWKKQLQKNFFDSNPVEKKIGYE